MRFCYIFMRKTQFAGFETRFHTLIYYFHTSITWDKLRYEIRNEENEIAVSSLSLFHFFDCNSNSIIFFLRVIYRLLFHFDQKLCIIFKFKWANNVDNIRNRSGRPYLWMENRRPCLLPTHSCNCYSAISVSLSTSNKLFIKSAEWIWHKEKHSSQCVMRSINSAM